jgi:hypothetical protein
LARLRCLWILSLVCLLLIGCDKNHPKKPDPTKGAVTGIVLCADTGKPARFATVTLSAAPKKDEKIEEGNPLPANESAVTDLDGRFKIEAVEPGQYYAFAKQEGYLDPMRGLDFARLGKLASDREQELDAIDQWKDHLIEFTVSAHRTADLSLQVERAAEIAGTVAFDDGSPAIGMHFQLSRKTEKGRWTDVGLALFSDWTIPAVSDSHGRFNLTNLTAGEYKVCALMPSDSQDSAPRICLGNTFRQKDAGTVKVKAAEIAYGVDIEIPLSRLHKVAGTVTAIADGHALKNATVRLLYADDREKAREAGSLEDGSFSFAYVPEGKYILAVTGAHDADQKESEPAPGDAQTAAPKTAAALRYADKELPLIVLDDVDDIKMQLDLTPPDKTQKQ